MTERHGSRPDTPAEMPAPTITSKARSDSFVVAPPPELRIKPTATMRERRRPMTEPAPTLAFGHNSAGWEFFLRPATTVSCDSRLAPPGHHDSQMRGSINVTERDALILQGFPPDYPLAGRTKDSRFTQIGNAVPPALAEAIVRAVTPGPVPTAEGFKVPRAQEASDPRDVAPGRPDNPGFSDGPEPHVHCLRCGHRTSRHQVRCLIQGCGCKQVDA